jgi:site-specific DNA recombinase
MDNDEKQLRVAIYLRVSTDEQVEKYGLDAQRSTIEAAIKSRGLLKDGRPAMVLADKNYIYSDDGVSGVVNLNERPAFSRIIEDISNSEDGLPFDVIAVYRIDRFARKLKILLEVLDLFKKHKLEFISATESIDTSSPFGRAMLGILGVIAELELETIKERTSKGKEAAVSQGKFMGTHPPYGYIKDKEGKIAILKAEAEIVKRIYKTFVLDRLSYQIIANKLAEDNILSPEVSAVKYGKRKGEVHKLNPNNFWMSGQIRDILSDEIYTGFYYYNKSHYGKLLPKQDWKLSPYRHKPIIPLHIFEISQTYVKQIADRKNLNKKKEENDHLYLLSSLLKCDHCKRDVNENEKYSTWTGVKKKLTNSPHKFSYYYQCNRKNDTKNSETCPTIPIPAEALENYVVEFVKELLKDPRHVYEYSRNLRSKKLESEVLADLEVRRQHYIDLLNGIPGRKKGYQDQHAVLMIIDTDTLKEKLAELNLKASEYQEKIKEIDYSISQSYLSEDYELGLNQYRERYKEVIEGRVADQKALYDLIHDLVYQVVVHSRPKTKEDSIAGKKKEGQMIPNTIDIYLNLPETILSDFIDREFSVINSDL